MKRAPLVIVAVLLVFLVAKPVSAQSGSCPLGTDDLGDLAGTYPDTTKVCRGDIFEFTESIMEILSDGSGFYPCGQYINYRRVTLGSGGDEREMYLVPPTGLSTGQQVRVRFYLMQGFVVTGPQPIKDWPIRFEYYNSNRLLIGYHDGFVTDYPVISTYFGTGAIKTYYNVYIVDQILSLSDSMAGGYLRFTHIPEFGLLADYTASKTAIASVQIGDDLPYMCEIPNYGYPPTPTIQPTPTGTLTPTPTGTLTPTPTMFPTAVGGTVTPVPTTTPTPITFATIQPELTPTPWQPYVIPTVRWPTPYPTIYASSASAQATAEAADPTRQWMTDGLLASADDINEAWGTPRAQARIWTDPEQTGYISTTTQTGEQITGFVSLPVGYVKGVQALMPNAWVFIAWIMSLVGLIVFSTVGKYFLAVFKALIYIIQLIWGFLIDIWNAVWELIPL